MRVVITRPVSDAPAWVAALQAAGHTTLTLPLIEVSPVTHVEPLQEAWRQWPKWSAVMFVSAPAVRYFFGNQGDAGQRQQASDQTGRHGPRYWATGPGTRKALLQAGVPEACIDSPAEDAPQFDSEALWQRVHGQVQAGQSVLIVRGQDEDLVAPTLPTKPSIHQASVGTGRDWLALQVQAAGASVHWVVAYVRQAPVWSMQQKAQAVQAASDASVWCFSSSLALQHLRRALPAQSWAQARCITTHARIAQTARALGFAQVHTTQARIADVLGSLEWLA